MCGKWKAIVKSVKHDLQHTVADLLLTYEDFSTFITQVEALLSSRTRSELTDDPDNICAHPWTVYPGCAPQHCS